MPKEKTSRVNTCEGLVATRHPAVTVAYGTIGRLMFTPTKNKARLVFVACQRDQAEGDYSWRKEKGPCSGLVDTLSSSSLSCVITTIARP